MPSPNFLAFVDTHGKLPAELKKKIRKEKPEFVVCAGDFTLFGREMGARLREISRLHKKVFLVHGNHEDKAQTALACRKYGVRFIHKKIVELGKIALIGYGGGGFAQRYLELEAWTKEIRKRAKELKKKGKKIVVVAHAPFYKTALDRIYGSHMGSKSLRGLIVAVRADFAVCGHFHENAGKEDRIWGCAVMNPGPKGKIFEITTPKE